MGFIARAQLASAVSNAGAFGIIETSSGRLDEVRDEMAAMRDRTRSPGESTSPRCSLLTPTSWTSWPTKGSRSSRRQLGIRPATPTSSMMPASPCSTWSRRCERRRRPSTLEWMGWWSRGEKVGASRARSPCRRWSFCRRSAGRSTSRSSPPEGLPTASPWPPPLRWAPKESRWGPAWSAQRSRRCTTTTSTSSAMPTPPTLSCSAHTRALPSGHADAFQREPGAGTVGGHGSDRRYGGGPQALLRR